MNALLFELKKLWKQKITLSVVLMAMLLSFYAVIILPSKEIFQPSLTTEIFQYPAEIFLGLDTPHRSIETATTREHDQDWEEINSQYAVEITQNYKMKDNIIMRSTSLIGSREMFGKVESFLSKFDYVFTPQAKDDFEYVVFLYDYYAKKGISEIYYPIMPNQYVDAEATVLPQGAAETLATRTKLLFGILPLVLFFFLGYTVVTQDYQSSRYQLLWMQPRGRFLLFLTQYISLLLQVVVYLFALCLSVFLFSLIRGGIGLLDLPLRVHLPGVQYLVQWRYIFLSMCVFLIRSGFFIALGTFLAMTFKQFDVGLFVGVFLGSIGYFLTQILVKLQMALNPFYIDYETILLGSRVEERMGGLGYPYTSNSPVGALPSIVLFISTVVVLLLAYQQRNRHSLQSGSLKSPPLKWGLSLELRKFLRLMPMKWFVGSMLVLSLILFLGMMIPDQIQRAHTIGAYQMEADQQEQLLESYQDNYNDMKKSGLDPVQKNQLLATIEKDMELARKQADLNAEIAQAAKTGDAARFYKAMLEELKDKISAKGYSFTVSELKEKELSQFSLDVMKKRYQWSLDHGVKPIVSSSFELGNITIYDDSATRVELDQLHAKRSQPLDISSGMLLYRLISYYSVHLFVLGGILLFFGGSYYLERVHAESMDTLYMQPKPRRYFYHTKVFASLGISLFVSAFLILTLVLVGLWGRPGGTWHLPVLHYDGLVTDAFLKQDYSEMYHFISLGSWLLRGLAVFMSMLICSLSMMHCLSVRLKSRWLVFALIFGGGLILMSLAPKMGNLAPYLPFSYWKLPHLLNGRLAIQLHPSLSFMNAILIHLIWAVLWYLAGLVLVSGMKLFRKEEK